MVCTISILILGLPSLAFTTSESWAGDGVINVRVSSGAVVRSTGPRSGRGGTAYFNIQGRSNGEDGRYASFGVLEFRLPKPISPATKLPAMQLTLTQSLPPFARDGKIRFLLVEDTKTSLDAESEPAVLKFDLKVKDGLASQLGASHPLGGGTFRKVETGRLDAFPLMPAPDAEAYLLDRLNRGELIRIVVLPDDDDVSATYYGIAPDRQENRPSLSW